MNENGKTKCLLKIGEMACKIGVPKSTICYYTKIGLLPFVARTQGGYRLYEESVVISRIETIRRMFANGKRHTGIFGGNGSDPNLQQVKQMLDK